MAKRDKFLLVDGYNIIFDWEKLKKLTSISIEIARDKLVDILANYAGVSEEKVIVVFDAHLVVGGVGNITEKNGITIVYTQEAETADSYIEKTTHKIARTARVRVATSDGLEQIIILGNGAYRISAREFLLEVNETEKKIRQKLDQIRPIKKNELMENVDEKTALWLEQMRRGK